MNISKVELTREAFKQWEAKFVLRRFTRINAYGESEQVLIKTILDDLETVKVTVGSNLQLRQNLLLSCFEAEKWNEENDSALEERLVWKDAFKELPDQAHISESLLSYIAKYQSFALNAMRSSAGRNEQTSSSSYEDLNDLIRLLTKYNRGTTAISDINHVSNLSISRDFEKGPFIFSDLSLVEKNYFLPHIKTLGLLFCLSYIFRYFSSEENTDHRPSVLRSDRLIIAGTMIDGGQPHFNLVAGLVNSTLGTKISTREAKEKLRDFLKPKKTERSKKTIHHIEWAGWPN